MEQLLSIVVVVIALTCVMVATQPTRPVNRRRRQSPVWSRQRAGAAVASARPARRPSDTQRWSRRDFQQAVTRDHAFPGGDQDVWPKR